MNDIYMVREDIDEGVMNEEQVLFYTVKENVMGIINDVIDNE